MGCILPENNSTFRNLVDLAIARMIQGSVSRDPSSSALVNPWMGPQDMRVGFEECRHSCEYFGLCGGGAGSNTYWENGSFASAETQACRYRIKMVADVVLERLEAAVGLAG